MKQVLRTFIAQRVDSIQIAHYFQFAENTDSVPQTFAHGDTTEVETLKTKTKNKNTTVFVCKSNSRYKDKDSMTAVTFIRSVRKILYPRCFSPVACTPRKVIRHMTSDFDVGEIRPGYAVVLSKRCAIHTLTLTGLHMCINTKQTEH